MAKRGRPRKVKAAVPNAEALVCLACHGTGIEEFNHGLLSRKCPTCGGLGKIETREGD